ncbi:type II toxin-antitoxin system death-on-curing family toxin [Euhalothece natronophila Z-M001]|uniref:Type II toxin-antitoxin system death-on-curing family toxin n=1 Tax=Euhalothece natronophila Z-M001 TaxID=522448 RepID=A0A5B8NKC9_9CHRO|nr:type II toxin-antitoxin system death-on-curing family toxin [Euhalothece natronophila]QDZ39327.1 type II toxin-antitoxin system death-on-curing family toxin [Euhalothece natronophila Z-M001]
MTRYLTLSEVLDLHALLIQQSGGRDGIRDRGSLESAISQPQMTFGGGNLYPTVIEKASALGFSLILNHPFLDGNKRTGHAAMETFLILNGWEIEASIDEQENIILGVASGKVDRETLTQWLREHTKPFD